MKLRALAVAAVVVTYLQLVFGGIVRITGSGMGCGDHWPRCNGSWIPPFSNPTVMIEWTHRLLALLVLLAIVWLVLASRRVAAQPSAVGVGIGNSAIRVQRSAVSGLVLVVAVALLGMLTVKLGNTALATAAHWTLAMALLGVLLATAVRTGALGGVAAHAQGGSPRSARSLGAGAAMAFVTVVLGGLTAKTAGAAAACPSLPWCGDTPAGIGSGAVTLQMTHRIVAYLLIFHAAAIAVAIGRRAGESAVVQLASRLAAGLVLLQVGLGAAMILSLMRAPLRVAHEAVGVAVWMAFFLAAYLARTAGSASRSPLSGSS